MKFKGLLWETLKIQTTSGHCDEMQEHVMEYLKKFHLKDITVDYSGNIIVTKGTADYYPTFVAHMDTVHDIVPKKKWKPSWKGDVISAPTGIGGDDKVGVAVTLWALKTLPVVKGIFTVDEEIGAIGAHNLSAHHLTNVGYMLQTDRRGNDDLITDYMGSATGSKEFLEVILPSAVRNGYKETSGVFTDVMILGPEADVSVLNISSGYHNPHTSREYVVVSEAIHTLNFMFELYQLLETGKKYTHQWEEMGYNRYSWSSTKSYGSFSGTRFYSRSIYDDIQTIYESTSNAVYEWVLYYLQISEETLEALWEDAKARGDSFKDYLIQRFEYQIQADLRAVGYTQHEIDIHLMQSQELYLYNEEGVYEY